MRQIDRIVETRFIASLPKDVLQSLIELRSETMAQPATDIAVSMALLLE
ncbi:hypothetical protein [Nostoc sp. DSM 114167]|jgi:hypothetical protein